MLRLVNITEQDNTHLTFETEEIIREDYIVYVMYDTSTGITDMQDYYSWRTFTSSTGNADVFSLEINNNTKYPGTEDNIPDYTIFDPKLFKVMTWSEHEIMQMLLTRIDLIRRRFPNPGITISDTDNIGQGGVIGFAGGWDKKFSIEELRQMVEGSLIEVNWQPPETYYWWQYSDEATDKLTNPYSRTSIGVPYDIADLVIHGAIIRCLVAWGLLEVDLSFSTSDSGLQVTYDRVASVQTWQQNLLKQFNENKILVKYNHVNPYGVGVGTYPFAVSALWGAAMNMISQGGTVPLSSMLGFGIRANTPM